MTGAVTALGLKAGLSAGMSTLAFNTPYVSLAVKLDPESPEGRTELCSGAATSLFLCLPQYQDEWFAETWPNRPPSAVCKTGCATCFLSYSVEASIDMTHVSHQQFSMSVFRDLMAFFIWKGKKKDFRSIVESQSGSFFNGSDEDSCLFGLQLVSIISGFLGNHSQISQCSKKCWHIMLYLLLLQYLLWN